MSYSLALQLIALFVILSAVGYITTYIRKATINRLLHGINTKRLVCPSCGAEAPKFRKPKNKRQLLWGGFTCEQCGAEVDKWGREIDPKLDT